jgi:DNA-binding transcriptional LysR family regulator
VHRVLGIVPLRSLVAVSDCGGFQRAANSLHLSQGAVSQHVRRLEEAVGKPLVERQGRGSMFTPAGDMLLQEARRILAAHDAALRLFDVEPDQSLVIGSTEHAADHMLPQLRQALLKAMPHREIRFRVDRGLQLREDLACGRIDLALVFGPADDPSATDVGHLDLSWYTAPGWSPRPGQPLPLVAFDDPCAIRARALETLDRHGVDAEVACEAPHLAGVQAAVRAGIGVALMVTQDRRSDGLVPFEGLPSAAQMEMTLWSRQGLMREVTEETADVLRKLPDAVDRRFVLPQAA